VTGDKTWVHLYKQCSKQLGYGVQTPHISKDKFKFQVSAGKVMLLLFWGCNGPIVEHYLEQGLLLLLHCTLNVKIKAAASDSQEVQRFAVQGKFFCSIIMHICIPWQLPLKQSGS
jgi:hypothetical protein